MKLEYRKTISDQAREVSDMKSNPVMRFLNNQEHFRFQIGQVLIKQTRNHSNDAWHTELIPGVGAPRKFMYAFENQYGIGYLKQLKVDGTGFTNALIFTANFDPETVRFQLDPDYVDHLLVGEGDFQYNKEYLDKKSYKADAIEKNKSILIRTGNYKVRRRWMQSLKPGDVFWAGRGIEEMVRAKYTVIRQAEHNPGMIVCDMQVEGFSAREMTIGDGEITYMNVTDKEPFPLQDPLCGKDRAKLPTT